MDTFEAEKFVKFEPNSKGRDFVCGDIHGCFDLLEKNLNKVKFDKENDRLFCVGDLVDRGPQSEKFIDYLNSDWFFSIKGNHEDMMQNAFTDNLSYRLHKNNGGEWFYDEKITHEERLLFCASLDKLPYIMQVGEYGLVHADIHPQTDDWDDLITMVTDPTHPEHKKALEMSLWSRWTVQWGKPRHIQNIKKVFCGHSILKEPLLLGNMHFIDTGSFLYYGMFKGSDGDIQIIELEH